MRLSASRLRGVAGPTPKKSVPARLYGTKEGIWVSPSTPNTLSKKRYEWDPATVEGDDVALVLDLSRGLQLGPDLRPNVTLGQIGTSNPSTFDSVTGAGYTQRVGVNNQSWISLSGLDAAKTYRFTIARTSGTNSFVVRWQSQSGTIVVAGVNATQREVWFSGHATMTVTSTADGHSGDFIVGPIQCVEGYHLRSPDDGASRGTLTMHNGHRFIYVDGIGDRFATGTLFSSVYSSSISAYAGFRKDAEALGYVFSQNVSAPKSWSIRTSDVSRLGFAHRGLTSSVVVLSPTPYAAPVTIVAGFRHTANALFDGQVNNDTPLSGIATSDYSGSTVAIGWGATANALNFVTGLLGEAMCFHAPVTNAEHTELMAYVNARTGAY
jgi:hypothetical protein